MVLNAGTSICPVCLRHWLVSPLDDCMLPTCGCFGKDVGASNGARPCERCGMWHGFNKPESCVATAVGRFLGALNG